MSVRDLGYRPYEGVRRPPSTNTLVLLRHALGRAWASWLVKSAMFLSWLPPIIAVVMVVGTYFVGGGAVQSADDVEAAKFIHGLFRWQFWLFVTMVTLGAGAGAIAQDLTFKAFQFYFAKPVTPAQYLAARIGAVTVWLLPLLVVPALLLVLAMAMTAAEGMRWGRIALFLPAVVVSIVYAAVCAVGSVSVSSLSRSRALTMSAWMLLLFVPHILSVIVFEVGGWPWLKLVSIPALLDILGDAVFDVPREDEDLAWYHAALVLGGLVVGGSWMAWFRLRQAEVIT